MITLLKNEVSNLENKILIYSDSHLNNVLQVIYLRKGFLNAKSDSLRPQFTLISDAKENDGHWT